ncbi:hypothetical protein [Chryseobacterium sp. FH1]|uniref:hypothetical protein n=1 Tax=Chryseobacterium sp. FH1 TaxID=1233951 RepID=UPI000B33ECFC|nr:hypothetical protein [Chryseobacterium sp. FH1]
MIGLDLVHQLVLPHRMELFFNLISVIICVLLTTASIVSITKYKLITKNEKWYVYYIIFIFLIEFTSYTMLILKFQNYAFLYPIYIAGEFFTVTGLYIKKLNLNKYYFLATGLLSIFFLTVDRIFGQYQYNDYSKAVSNIIMTVLIGYSLIQDIRNIRNKSSFQLIDKIFFLYFTVSIFIFIFQNQLIAFPKDYFTSIWVINNLMSCMLYSLFIYTFFKKITIKQQ